MFAKRSRTPCRPPRLLLRIRRALPAAIAALLCAGLAISAAHGQEGRAAPALDRAALSEIARDVLRHGATAAESDPEPTSPGAAAASALPIATGAPDPAPPIAHIGPVRESISVRIPPRLAARRKAAAQSPSNSYESNSWRQRPPETSRALGFSSGVLPPSSGLDPALAAHADGARAQGRAVRLRLPASALATGRGVQKTLAGRGVKLLGPPRRPREGPTAACGGPPGGRTARRGVGRGQRAASRSSAPSWRRCARPREKAAAVGDETGLPIVVNLFDDDQDGSFRPPARGRRGCRRRVRPGAPLLSRGGDVAGDRGDHRARLRAVRRVIRPMSPGHDQSTPLVDADLIRPGLVSSPPRFGGASIPVGIIDSGFMVGDPPPFRTTTSPSSAAG